MFVCRYFLENHLYFSTYGMRRWLVNCYARRILFLISGKIIINKNQKTTERHKGSRNATYKYYHSYFPLQYLFPHTKITHVQKGRYRGRLQIYPRASNSVNVNGCWTPVYVELYRRRTLKYEEASLTAALRVSASGGSFMGGS